MYRQLLYCYKFNPEKLKLNRDRKMLFGIISRVTLKMYIKQKTGRLLKSIEVKDFNAWYVCMDIYNVTLIVLL